MAGLKGNRQRKSGQGVQLPSHVQTSLNKEERLLQRNLLDLEKETRHNMRCIVQDQQVAGTKLRSLQSRLLASQKKFHALINPSPPREEEMNELSLASIASEVIQENEDGKRSRKASLYQDNSESSRQQEEEWQEERTLLERRASSRKGSRGYLRSSLRATGGKRRASTLKIRQKNVVFTQ